MASRAESNTGHIGRGQGLSPLHQSFSSLSAIWAQAPSSYCLENSMKQYGYVKFLIVLASSLILGRSSNVRVIRFFGVSRFFLLFTITRGNSTRNGLNRWLIQPFFLSEDLSFSLLSGWRGLRNSPGRLLALWKVIIELQQWQLQRQEKRHLRIKTWGIVTILRLSQFIRILQWWRRTLQLVWCHWVQNCTKYRELKISGCTLKLSSK